MFKVIGCKKQEGIFNGREYKNYVLYVVNTEKNETDIFGLCPQTLKVKQNFIINNNIDINSLYQQNIEVLYDSYRNVAKIDVVSK